MSARKKNDINCILYFQTVNICYFTSTFFDAKRRPIGQSSQTKLHSVYPNKPPQQSSYLSPHQNVSPFLYRNPSFTLNIDTQAPNPSKVYAKEMKSLMMEDLSSGIRERTHSLKRHQDEREQ